MAIAFDSASYAEGTGTGLNGTPIALTASGSNRMVFVGVSYQDAGAISGITYDGVAMTKLDGEATAGSGNYDLWYIANPSTTTNAPIVVSTTNNGTWQIGAVSYTGVANTAPTPTNSTLSDNSALTSTSDNSWHVMWASRGVNSGANCSAGSGTTQRTSTSQESGMFDKGGPITPAGSSTITATSAIVNVGAIFRPVISATFTESFTLTESMRRARSYSESLTMKQVSVLTFTETITMSDTYLRFERFWRNLAKNVGTWVNRSKT